MARTELSLGERKIVINMHRMGKSYTEIGKLVKRSRSTIQKVVNRFKQENRIENKARTGRPRKLSEREERYICNEAWKDPKKSAVKLAVEVQKNFDTTVHEETIRRVLHKSNLKSYSARKKPYVSEINRKKRLEFAKKYKGVEPEFWKKVIWSDESKFNLFGPDGHGRVWRKPKEALNPKNTIKTVKHGGGGIMVWGCMAASGVGNMVIIDGIMDHKVYLNILKENLQASAEKLGLQDTFYFQQDNDPKHKSYVVRQWLVYNVPHLLETPPQSPDLNPIEHLWSILGKKIREHVIQNKTDLKHVILEEWSKISISLTQKLVLSMPNRLSEVIKLKGYPTRY